MLNHLKTLWAFILRWQEKTILLPILAGLALGAWILVGALDTTAGKDVLASLIELPIRTGFAAAALALTYLARRRWRYKLNAEQQEWWWSGVIAGYRGPLIIYLTDALFTLVCLALLLRFFSAH